MIMHKLFIPLLNIKIEIKRGGEWWLNVTKVGIFGDIHSNFRALGVALKDADEQGVSLGNIRFNGDIVGYGKDPIKCLYIVRFLTGDLGEIADDLMQTIPHNYRSSVVSAKANNGNHEIALLMKAGGSVKNLKDYGIAGGAEEAIDLTVKAIQDELSSAEGKGILARLGKLASVLRPGEEVNARTHLNYLAELPMELIETIDGVRLHIVHANPLNPEDSAGYIFDAELAQEFGKKNFISPSDIFRSSLADRFDLFAFSHTHFGRIYVGNGLGDCRIYEDELTVDDIRKSDTKIGVATGSVGYPRLGDENACYPIIDTQGPVLVKLRRINING